MTFADFQREQARLEALHAEASAALREVPGISSGPMRLTPDDVKARSDYRAAKAAYDRAFSRLRSFNGEYVRRFSREIRAARDTRRAAKVAAFSNQ